MLADYASAVAAVLFMPIKILLPFFRIWIFPTVMLGTSPATRLFPFPLPSPIHSNVLSNVRREVFVDALQSKTPRRAEGWRSFWAKETPDVLRNWTHMLCVEGGESVCVCV